MDLATMHLQRVLIVMFRADVCVCVFEESFKLSVGVVELLVPTTLQVATNFSS